MAYFVVRWDAGLWTKYAALLPTAFAISAALALLLSRLSGVSTLPGLKRSAVPTPQPRG